jgi:hypothetical protein
MKLNKYKFNLEGNAFVFYNAVDFDVALALFKKDYPNEKILSVHGHLEYDYYELKLTLSELHMIEFSVDQFLIEYAPVDVYSEYEKLLDKIKNIIKGGNVK